MSEPVKTCPITSPRYYRQIEGETKEHQSYSFPIRCREKWVRIMRRARYAEYDQFEGIADEHTPGFLCANCSYARKDDGQYVPKSNPGHTGLWCEEWKFPDQLHGCCVSHKLIENYTPPAGTVRR